MKHKTRWLTLLIAAALLYPVIGYSCEEQQIPLAAVPEHILAAAESALSGVQLVEAELISNNSQLFYEPRGSKTIPRMRF